MMGGEFIHKPEEALSMIANKEKYEEYKRTTTDPMTLREFSEIDHNNCADRIGCNDQ